MSVEIRIFTFWTKHFFVRRYVRGSEGPKDIFKYIVFLEIITTSAYELQELLAVTQRLRVERWSGYTCLYAVLSSQEFMDIYSEKEPSQNNDWIELTPLQTLHFLPKNKSHPSVLFLIFKRDLLEASGSITNMWGMIDSI